MEGSRLQPGDEDLAQVPFGDLKGRYLVVEEKLDGANAAISFNSDGTLRLQSRGHYLTGGPRERQFDLLKPWAAALAPRLWAKLRDRYVMYGEWLYAKHTVYYDALPHYFCEFDVYDRVDDVFLSTASRRELLDGLPITSVPVLWHGRAETLRTLTSLIGPSTCRTADWRARLRTDAAAAGTDPDRALAETDNEDAMEGLYLKWELNGQTRGRYKWVRPSFLTAVLDSQSHWMQRPIVPNRLRDPETMYAGI